MSPSRRRPGGSVRETVADRVVSALEILVKEVALAGQLIRIGQAVRLGPQLLVLTRPDLRAHDLAELEADEVGTALQFAPPLPERGDPLPQARDPLEGLLNLGGQVPAPGEGIQHHTLEVTRQKPLVLVLSMDIHQQRPDSAQDAGRDRGPVHPAAAPPFGAYFAAEDQVAVLGFESQLGEQVAHLVQTVNPHHPLHQRPPLPAAHDTRRGASPQQHLHGVHDDRLSSPGLPRHNIESCLKRYR